MGDARSTPFDIVVGGAALAGAVVMVVARRTRPFVRPVVTPVVKVVLVPPMVPEPLQPAVLLEELGRRGAAVRMSYGEEAVRLVERVRTAATTAQQNGHRAHRPHPDRPYFHRKRVHRQTPVDPEREG